MENLTCALYFLGGGLVACMVMWAYEQAEKAQAQKGGPIVDATDEIVTDEDRRFEYQLLLAEARQRAREEDAHRAEYQDGYEKLQWLSRQPAGRFTVEELSFLLATRQPDYRLDAESAAFVRTLYGRLTMADEWEYP